MGQDPDVNEQVEALRSEVADLRKATRLREADDAFAVRRDALVGRGRVRPTHGIATAIGLSTFLLAGMAFALASTRGGAIEAVGGLSFLVIGGVGASMVWRNADAYDRAERERDERRDAIERGAP